MYSDKQQGRSKADVAMRLLWFFLLLFFGLGVTALALWAGPLWAIACVLVAAVLGGVWGSQSIDYLDRLCRLSNSNEENRFKTAMQGASLGFWDSDLRTGLTYRDTFWFALLSIPTSHHGYQHEDWYQRVAPEEREAVMATFNQHLQQVGDFVELDYRIRKWDGRYMWVQDRARVMAVDKQGRPTRIVGVMQEVTRRKQIELELENARNDAVEANRSRDQFMAGISHEIRTPLNAIIGMASMLRDADLAEADKEQLRVIHRSAYALLEMVDTLLDFSRIQAGKIALNVEEFAPCALIGEVVELFKLQAMEKGLRMGQSVGVEVPEFIEGDAIRIRQVLSNLISNAVKFSNKGSVEVEAHLLQEVELPPKARAQINANAPFLQGMQHSYLYVGVRDEGIGIPRYAEKEIFEAFSQLEGSADIPNVGSGLGLAICSQIVQAMGGAIWVDSVFGQGCHFQFVVRVGIACFLAETSNEFAGSYTLAKRLLIVGCSPAQVAALQADATAQGLKLRAMDNYAAVSEEVIMRNSFALVVSLADGKGVHAVMRTLSRIPNAAKPERLIAIEASGPQSIQPEEALLLGFQSVLADLPSVLQRVKA